MRPFGSKSTLISVCLVLTVLTGCRGGSAITIARTQFAADAGVGDASPSGLRPHDPSATGGMAVPLANEPATQVCTAPAGCPIPAIAPPPIAPPRSERPSIGGQCTVATDCVTGRCVRGACTAGRAGDACESHADCDTFCNLATLRCNEFCVDPTACR